MRIVEPNLPVALVRQKAHQRWRERQQSGEIGSAEEDWQWAVEYYQKRPWRVRFWHWRRWGTLFFRFLGSCISAPFRLIGLLLRLLSDVPRLLSSEETRAYGLDIIKTILTALAGVALILNFWDATEDRRLTQERLVTERYIKAAELLGADGSNKDKPKKVSVRSGGIYSLERIAKDSPRDHWTIMEVLTTYVQNESPVVNNLELPSCLDDLDWQESKICQAEYQTFIDENKISLDVQAALTVIGRRNVSRDCYYPFLQRFLWLPVMDLWWFATSLWSSDNSDKLYACSNQIFLANSNLINSNLEKAKFINASFSGANLTGASLYEANLTKASLDGANFTNTQLHKANLTNASLSQATLTNASLEAVNFTNARLHEANFTNASLFEANLLNAFLREADLTNAFLNETNLTNADLGGANLTNADLEGANFTNASLFQTNLTNADLEKVNFTNAFLDETNLEKTILVDTDFVNSNPERWSQLKSACNWDKAYYFGDWNYDEEKPKWVLNEQQQKQNQAHIQKIRDYIANNPEPSEKPDCSRWEKE